MKGYKTVGSVKRLSSNEKSRKNAGTKTNEKKIFFSQNRQSVEAVLNKLKKNKIVE